MGLLLPERVVREIREERRADFERGVRTGVCLQFTRELQKIDPGLELVWWPETASAPGFTPGRYHVVWHHPGDGVGSVEPFVDDLGGYREPDSSLFEVVRKSDMWNDRLMHEQKRVREQALKAKEKREREEREEIHREAMERWKAVTETSVSMNRDVPWSQNVNGRRATRAG